MVGGKIRRITFCDTRKSYEIQTSVSINKVVMGHGHVHLSMYGLWLFSHYSAELSIWDRDSMAHKATLCSTYNPHNNFAS